MGMIERETLLLKCYSYVTASDSMKLLIFCAILIMCIAQVAWAAPEPSPIFFFGGREALVETVAMVATEVDGVETAEARVVIKVVDGTVNETEENSKTKL